MKQESDLELRLFGMPGNLHLTTEESDKYFGEKSRSEFYERVSFIHGQRRISCINDEEVVDLKLYDKKNRPDKIIEKNFPFSPIRATANNNCDNNSIINDDIMLQNSIRRSNVNGSNDDDDIDLVAYEASVGSLGLLPSIVSTPIDKIDNIDKLCLGEEGFSVADYSSDNSDGNNDDDKSSMMDTVNFNSTIDDSKDILTSPRTMYISCCLAEKIHPRPSLMIRRNFTKKIDLSHQSIGDVMARY